MVPYHNLYWTAGSVYRGTRIWYWQSQEDKFPNATNPNVYAAFNKFDPSSATSPIDCLAASWHEAFAVTGSTTVWAWTGRACSTQLPFMCKRKRELREPPLDERHMHWSELADVAYGGSYAISLRHACSRLFSPLQPPFM